MKTEAIWRANTQQCIFRELLEAFSRPGDIRDIGAWIEDATAPLAVLATLMDGETTLADPHTQITDTQWPLLQAKPDTCKNARYIIADGHCCPDFQASLGSLESPEFGATLLILVDRVGQGEVDLELTGPGIDGKKNLNLAGLHSAWLTCRADWVGAFPMGVDLLLVDAQRVVALPRTTRIASTAEVI